MTKRGEGRILTVSTVLIELVHYRHAAMVAWAEEGGHQVLTLNYRDARPIYRQIKDGIRNLILKGVIAPDEKLPSVRSLATELAINPNTIQRAYAELESEGVVYSVAGKGSFAAPRQEAAQARREELFGQLRTLVGELHDLNVSDEEIIRQIKGGTET